MIITGSGSTRVQRYKKNIISNSPPASAVLVMHVSGPKRARSVLCGTRHAQKAVKTCTFSTTRLRGRIPTPKIIRGKGLYCRWNGRRRFWRGRCSSHPSFR